MATPEDVNKVKEGFRKDIQAAKDYYAAQEVKADTFLDDLKNLKWTALILFVSGVIVVSGAVKVLLFC